MCPRNSLRLSPGWTLTNWSIISLSRRTPGNSGISPQVRRSWMGNNGALMFGWTTGNLTAPAFHATLVEMQNRIGVKQE